MVPELGQHIRGPQRRGRRFMALIARASTGPIGCLLHGVYREHSKTDRQTMLHGNLAQTQGGLTRSVLEVWGVAPDNRAQSNQAAVRLRLCGDRRRHWKLEGTRQPDNINGIPTDAGLGATRQSAIQELGRDQLIVAAYQDRHSPAGAQAAGEVGHQVSE